MKEYRQIIDELAEFTEAKSGEPDVNEHVHVAWVCLAEDGRRVEDAEIELHERLADFMPVLGVVTKARADDGFRNEVQRLLPEARNVVRVRALRERYDDGHVAPPMGVAGPRGRDGGGDSGSGPTGLRGSPEGEHRPQEAPSAQDRGGGPPQPRLWQGQAPYRSPTPRC